MVQCANEEILVKGKTRKFAQNKNLYVHTICSKISYVDVALYFLDKEFILERQKGLQEILDSVLARYLFSRHFI